TPHGWEGRGSRGARRHHGPPTRGMTARTPDALDGAPAHHRVGFVVLTNGVSRLQTNELNSTCRPSCHGHTLPLRWSKACHPARSGGVYDHYHRVNHGLILSGG